MATTKIKRDKWKPEPWLVPGAKVRVGRGRNIPIGWEGTVLDVYGTGNGTKAMVDFPGHPDKWSLPENATHYEVWIANLDPA